MPHQIGENAPRSRADPHEGAGPSRQRSSGISRCIEKASPGPRLELFARDKPDGWWAWGKEVPPDFFSKRYA
jgi:hypothetical protein